MLIIKLIHKMRYYVAISSCYIKNPGQLQGPLFVPPDLAAYA